ncbi:hypothetical protein RJ641_001061 [Dillenia turbinata]|uniref:CBF1-interacting co-repressor CIR N-terminal domain-containing protein n=1 Tax=Dillenia turbinata TaxID=194707 RepID=A0AAN8W7I6_9MAGN
MGGHGGLNILPQKRWNVYNYENREKVRKDEEAAAREEQIKREQSRKRDAEFRLEKLRQAKGLQPLTKPSTPSSTSESDSKHINLFDGIKIFDPIKPSEEENNGGVYKQIKKLKREVEKQKHKDAITPEDEKYKLGYGIAGKGVKLPWYLERRTDGGESGGGTDEEVKEAKEVVRGNGEKKKRTLEELREERFKREKKAQERERELLREKTRRDGGFSSR